MINVFYEISGEVFRMICHDDDGEWLISYDTPSTPVFVSNEALLDYRRVEPPKEYVSNIERGDCISQPQRVRLEMIQPLLEDDKCIYDRNHRNTLCQDISEKNNTTKKRILRLYYKYLAKKTLIESKNLSATDELKYEHYKWAIKTYYYSAKKLSLRMTYDMMLLKKYMDADGKLKSDIPTWDSFRHFFYDNNYNKISQKSISRNGLSSYQREERPLFGSAMSWKDKIGHYQIDATDADIYIVSRFDSSIVIGRPNIFMAVDTITQLIAGIYVGLESDESAAIACIANAAEDKVEFCERYGIEIKKEQWPSTGIPGSIITDQGKEFMGSRVEELCYKYGMEIETLPPFRPDEKSLVEKMFDILQTRYKPLLRGKGVIEADAKERWAIDYREQAILNLDEFIKVIINCVLYINSGRLLENYIPSSEIIRNNIPLVPANLWCWFDINNRTAVMPVNKQDIYLMSLKRKDCKINRKGIYHNGFWYKNLSISRILETVKSNVKIAYDMNNISFIYLILDGEYIKFDLADHYTQYNNLNMTECEIVKSTIREQKKKFEQVQTQSRVNLLKNIKAIIKEADKTPKLKQNGVEIRKNREEEKGKFS
jgi:hypothetical protein